MLLCPECNDVIIDRACKSGKHRFESKAGVLDLMPQLTAPDRRGTVHRQGG